MKEKMSYYTTLWRSATRLRGLKYGVLQYENKVKMGTEEWKEFSYLYRFLEAIEIYFVCIYKSHYYDFKDYGIEFIKIETKNHGGEDEHYSYSKEDLKKIDHIANVDKITKKLVGNAKCDIELMNYGFCDAAGYHRINIRYKMRMFKDEDDIDFLLREHHEKLCHEFGKKLGVLNEEET